MGFVNFIEFNTDKETALSIRTSPVIEFHTFTGVQLLPNNELPYVQTTNVSGGIELEDWTARVLKVCKNEEDQTGYDVTSNFLVESVFQDINGQAQFTWSLTNVDKDFGYELVYLEVKQAFGETFYSSQFQLTDYESEKTCRLDYKENEDDTMQSIQVHMYYWQDLEETELGSYYEISTKRTVTTLVKEQKFERWRTDFISNRLFMKINDALKSIYTYVDLSRADLYKANEIKPLESGGDFHDNIIDLDFDYNDTYNPLYIESTSPILYPSITLLSVVVNGQSAIYSFTYENFDPREFSFSAFNYDLDESRSETSGVTSSQIIPFSETGTWEFLIRHSEAVSNTITLELGQDVEAINDNVTIQKGEVIEIDPLTNDVLVGETLITAVSNPSNGSVVIIDSGKKIEYTHDNGSSLNDSFTYTISNGVSSDTATVNVSIPATSTLTGFSVNLTGHSAKQNACTLIPNDTKYHNGAGALPELGDVISNFDEFLYPFDGDSKYYSITGGKAIRIGSNGVVTSVQLC